MKYRVILFILIFTFVSFQVQASEIAALVQKKYETIESFQAGFVQIMTNASTREQHERIGQISFQKPLNVRWETTSPEPELLVMDEENVWNFFPEEEAAYLYKPDDIITSRTMVRFISGQARLAEDFRIEEQEREYGLNKLKLVPRRPEPDLVLAYLWADDQGVMHRILLVDFFGNGNELILKDIDLNPEFEQDTFRFSPPGGVDIIEN